MIIFRGILVGFVVVLAVLAVALSARMVGVRNTWSEKVADLRKDNEEKAASLLAQEKTLADAKAEISRLNLGWDRMWDEVAVVGNVEGDAVEAFIGSDNGVGPREINDENGTVQQIAPVLYGFRELAAGEYEYAGEFLVDLDVLEPDRCLLRPTWRLRAGETDSWQGNWRLRSQIPSHFKTRFRGLYDRLFRNDGYMTAATTDLEKQNSLFVNAGNELSVRQHELGFGVQTGLVPDIEAAEDVRNSLQLHVDLLRRRIKTESDLQEQLKQTSQQLVNRLPKPAPRVSRAAE